MTTLQQFKEEQMKDPAFRNAYDDSEPEMNRIRAIADTGNIRYITKEMKENIDFPKENRLD